ncbi:hypothetical protein FB563_7159 [Streptomyces puniciscabiei]|uniref:Uncharacterized protein n=1 Tax=Streptomyces puniciscabiei TaxID=164348 RepID=A0A542SZF0_9ACTN|nr:hypothetical protein FB563_7159 [Streptomyces puniciscabiei]
MVSRCAPLNAENDLRSLGGLGAVGPGGPTTPPGRPGVAATARALGPGGSSLLWRGPPTSSPVLVDEGRLRLSFDGGIPPERADAVQGLSVRRAPSPRPSAPARRSSFRIGRNTSAARLRTSLCPGTAMTSRCRSFPSTRSETCSVPEHLPGLQTAAKRVTGAGRLSLLPAHGDGGYEVRGCRHRRCRRGPAPVARRRTGAGRTAAQALRGLLDAEARPRTSFSMPRPWWTTTTMWRCWSSDATKSEVARPVGQSSA